MWGDRRRGTHRRINPRKTNIRIPHSTHLWTYTAQYADNKKSSYIPTSASVSRLRVCFRLGNEERFGVWVCGVTGRVRGWGVNNWLTV